MESTRSDAQGSKDKETKVGQIVIELRRMTLGQRIAEMNYRPRHLEGQEEDIDMERAPRGVTHATG